MHIRSEYLLLSAVSVIALCAANPVKADNNYVTLGVGAGLTFSPDTQNSDEVEFGHETGWLASVAAGRNFEVDEDFSVRGEVEASFRQNPLHGKNNKGNAPGQKQSADGEEIDAFALTLNAWPTYTFWHDEDFNVSAYAGAGVGFATMWAFGDNAVAAQLEPGVGVLVNFGKYDVDVGYRYIWTNPTDLGGAEATYDLHAAMVRVGYRF